MKLLIDKELVEGKIWELLRQNNSEGLNMVFEARAYKVMIASPTDVSDERGIIRQEIYKWNDLHSEDKKIILLPVGWETHLSPEMGDRPQAIINKRILKDCDLLVGIFWTRIGTATGKAVSGTVEEIEEHMLEEKPAMIYFSSVPTEPDNIDHEQYEKLKSFKEECYKKGIVESYKTMPEFKEKFREQLTRKISEHEYFQVDDVAETANQVTETQGHLSSVKLSKEAKDLLIEASASPSGLVIARRTMSGYQVVANDTRFFEGGNPKTEAAWKAAVKQLCENDFLDEEGAQGLFRVTHPGYQFVEQLKLE